MVFICLVNSRADPLEEIASKDTDHGVNLEGVTKIGSKTSINTSKDFGEECEVLEINGLLSGILGFKLSCDLNNQPKDQLLMSIHSIFLLSICKA